jgi:hypothetical protein
LSFQLSEKPDCDPNQPLKKNFLSCRKPTFNSLKSAGGGAASRAVRYTAKLGTGFQNKPAPAGWLMDDPILANQFMA